MTAAAKRAIIGPKTNRGAAWRLRGSDASTLTPDVGNATVGRVRNHCGSFQRAGALSGVRCFFAGQPLGGTGTFFTERSVESGDLGVPERSGSGPRGSALGPGHVREA